MERLKLLAQIDIDKLSDEDLCYLFPSPMIRSYNDVWDEEPEQQQRKPKYIRLWQCKADEAAFITEMAERTAQNEFYPFTLNLHTTAKEMGICRRRFETIRQRFTEMGILFACKGTAANKTATGYLLLAYELVKHLPDLCNTEAAGYEELLQYYTDMANKQIELYSKLLNKGE